MKEVLIDNMSFSRIFYKYFDEDAVAKNELDFKSDYNVQMYLFGLVLWDKIYSLEWNDYRYEASMSSYNLSLLEQVKGHIYAKGIRDYTSIEELKCKHKGLYVSEITKIANNLTDEIVRVCPDEEESVVRDTLFYIILSHNEKMDLLLSKPRTEFCIRNNIHRELFNALDVIGLIERDVIDYYNSINKMMQKDYIHFECPLLADYICENAGDFKAAIQVAKELRKDKKIVNFRKAMNKMEKALSEGDCVLFKEYMRAASEIVNDLTDSKKQNKRVNLIVNPTPTIEIPIEFKPRKKKLLHVDFLTDLATYGVKHRGRTRY